MRGYSHEMSHILFFLSQGHMGPQGPQGPPGPKGEKVHSHTCLLSLIAICTFNVSNELWRPIMAAALNNVRLSCSSLSLSFLMRWNFSHVPN